MLSVVCQRDCARNRSCRLSGIRYELFLTNVCNVAVWADQNPWPFGRGQVSGMGAAHVMKESASIGKQGVWHAVSGMQSSQSLSRG